MLWERDVEKRGREETYTQRQHVIETHIKDIKKTHKRRHSVQEWVSASNTTTWTLKSSTEEFPRMSKAFSRGSVLLFISRRIAQSHLAFMLVFVTIPTQYISHSLASFLASAPICEPHIHTTPSQTQLNNNIITEMLFSCRRHFGSVSKNSSKAGRRAMCNF